MNNNRILLIALISIILSVLLSNFSDRITNKTRFTKQVENVLNQKLEISDRLFQRMEKADDQEEIADIIHSSEREGIVVLKYISDSLAFWTSNAIPVFEFYNPELFLPGIIKWFNSYYYVEQAEFGSVRYVALINLYNSYPYDNEFLVTGFQLDFSLPQGSTIGFEEGEGYAVYSADDDYLFSAIISEPGNELSTRLVIASTLFFLGIIMLLFFMLNALQKYFKRTHNSGPIIITVLGILLIRVLQLYFGLNITGFLLFSPYAYAESIIAPSLGDLLINSLLVLFSAYLIFTGIHKDNTFLKKYTARNLLFPVFLCLVFMLFFIHAHYFSHSLIYNSSISFLPSSINKLNAYTFIGFLINGMNYVSAGLILLWVIQMLNLKENLVRIVQVFISTSALVFLGLFLLDHYPVDTVSLVFFYLFSILITFLYSHHRDLTKYSVQVLFLVLFSIYYFVFVKFEGEKKEAKVRSSLALSLANEHDPVAEYLFEDLSRKIENDTIIGNQYFQNEIELYTLPDYLEKEYFNGYWKKYNLQIAICRPADSIIIENSDYFWYHCYRFYNEIVEEIGFELPDSKFYYLDKPTGEISYLGIFPYHPEGTSNEVTLFIELDSRQLDEFLGYPELLLDKKLQETRLVDKYSYAKYYHGSLVAKHGEFSYSLSADLFGPIESDFKSVSLDGYNHLLYKPERESLIVLSEPKLRTIDLLVGFSYIFLFYYLCLLLIIAYQRIRNPNLRLLANLRSKIQFSVMSILLLSLILIAASTIWLSIRNYRKSQNEILEEKLQSVLIELTHKLAGEDELTREWSAPKYDNLNQLLIKFSDVFYTDINLYTPQGDLLATSRYEIFDLGLQGEIINPLAFIKLHNEMRSRYVHREKIGKLKFLSAYLPFKNSEGKLLAYLNLPYFTKQKDLQDSLSTLILTIVNIYILLIILAVVLAIFISDQITRPLEMLQVKFRELKIGNKYDQIAYKGRDEIGSLVSEYNKMVLELERSINLLARSERESAWREMAKQIAHEIKNPLTPMRLSVQQLDKLWKERREDFEKYLNNVTTTLIEQIDNLSAIASEFSNFAKMPVARFEKTNIIDVLDKAVHLFDGNKTINIEFSAPSKAIFVNADKEQLSRVFINIIKNGIQSIPDSREGKIAIKVQYAKNTVLVKLKDNGKGIPEDIRSKLFMPNFTTKSSGMGLGLAIVKNIVEQMQGEISFNTEVDKGSEFILKFPTV